MLSAGVPAAVKAVLELGGVSETVRGAEQQRDDSDHQSPTVASDASSVNQISKLPVTSRNALDFVVNLPGVQHAGRHRAIRPINGLPQSAINITLDGMNIAGQLPEDHRRLLRAPAARGSTRSRKSR